jgi:hypothetical protein
MVQETSNGTGRQGYQADLEADRARLMTTATVKDADQDGIADDWEQAHGLTPADPADGNQRSPSGYTFLERYCHERAEQLIQAATK